jgi:hypothetical protein
VFTQPEDLAEDVLRDALRERWNFRASSLSYQPVGFGSHHWLAAGARCDQLFVTVDDLAAKLRTADDTTDAAFGRLERAFTTALSLRRDAGLDFVVAPIPAADGRVLLRVQDRYSLVIHPYLAGCQPGHCGDFDTGAERRAVLDLLIALHGARAAAPCGDDLVLPRRAELESALNRTGEPWRAGPYGSRARRLLATHADDLALLLAGYDALSAHAAAQPDRAVITHGEPNAANVLKAPGGFVFVDWDSVLLAPPERDLWELAEGDPAMLDDYASATGVAIDRHALTLYRMWYDLAEIAGYVYAFREPHADTADAAEAWQNLQHFLRPAERWPGLLHRQTSSGTGAATPLLVCHADDRGC